MLTTLLNINLALAALIVLSLLQVKYNRKFYLVVIVLMIPVFLYFASCGNNIMYVVSGIVCHCFIRIWRDK